MNVEVSEAGDAIEKEEMQLIYDSRGKGCHITVASVFVQRLVQTDSASLMTVTRWGNCDWLSLALQTATVTVT